MGIFGEFQNIKMVIREPFSSCLALMFNEFICPNVKAIL